MTSTWIVARAGVQHRRRPARRGARSRRRGSTARRRRAPHQIGWSIELRQWLHAYSAVLGHPHDRRVLAAVRAHRAQLEAVQAVHAAVAAGEVRRPQPRLVAGRADVAEIDVRRRSSRPPAQPRDEEPVRAVPVRECLLRTRARSDGPRPGRRTAGRSSREVVVARPGSCRSTSSFSAGRDRAGRVDEHAAGARRACGAGVEDRRLRAGQLGGGRRAPCASGRRGATASVPRSEHGGSTSTRSYAPLVRLGGVGGADLDAASAPIRAAVRASASARPGWRSTRHARRGPPSARRGASSCRRARRTGRARARRAAGPAARATAIAARDCGMNRPVAPTAASRTRRTAPSSTRPSGQRGRRRATRPAAAPRGRRGAMRSVLARSGGLGRLVVGRHQRPRGVGAERVEPELGDPARVRVAQRAASAGVAVGQRGHERGRLARRPPQDGVDEAARRAATRAWRARPTRRRRRAAGTRSRNTSWSSPSRSAASTAGSSRWTRRLGERLDHVVERRAALDDAVREPHRERAVARVERRRASPCSARSA